MNHTRTTHPAMAEADNRIPFPRTDAPTRCQDDPELFAIEDITGQRAKDKALARARRACSGCPIVKNCLKWALANPDRTPTGVWAATTARQRTGLRKRLVQRLGADWVAVVAEQDRRERRWKPTGRERALDPLEMELIPRRPAPYEPWREPLTPARRAHNQRLLLAGLNTEAVA
ncbi:WhiB family transcriptional regulator [Streptomyces armeniacus]|uniref:WhiB family transcriptional regulator n=1 Tax=Streptomyces armeniacus TaxID=83291 RepID=A0A345XSQ2_9ACTN|nr:WhiB family transcriptional regulator [Streptomyces armeniacus]AXK34668.1 WhiB family transcriptional regulator [Streptomyces armeniacus]